MAATNVSHGVINIDVKPSRAATGTQQFDALAATNHAVTIASPPPEVVVHKTTSEIEAEAKALEAAAEQLKTDAASIQTSA